MYKARTHDDVKPQDIYRIANCQIGSIVGDVEGNFAKIKTLYNKYATMEGDEKVDLVVFPELATCGYLAKDLLLDDSFIDYIDTKLEELVKITNNTVLLLPTIFREKNAKEENGKEENAKEENSEEANHKERKGKEVSSGERSGKLYNAVLVIQNGKIIGKSYKAKLPSYGIFDERRYFTPGKPAVIQAGKYKLGIPICEDIWTDEICKDLAAQGAELFIIPNASPYEVGKQNMRTNIVTQRTKETGIPALYCNQAVAHDGIVFDGNSFCIDSSYLNIGPSYDEKDKIVTFAKGFFQTKGRMLYQATLTDEVYGAVKMALRDYVRHNGFEKVILGISGGIDSAVVACICADALGPENVTGYMLPSFYSSEDAKEDAKKLCRNLGIQLKTYPITQSVDVLVKTLDIDFDWGNADLTVQNLQSRLRGTILMALSNMSGAMLVTTGNKSEYACGYATIYGDMNGGFNPIKDIYKTGIYQLAKVRNQMSPVIPESIIKRAPSAELTSYQKDTDSLPDYEILDQILVEYIDRKTPIEKIKQKYTESVVDEVVGLIQKSEYKRQQSAPGAKVTNMAFDQDRRFPITNHYIK